MKETSIKTARTGKRTGKKRAYSREKFKAQVTVRIEEWLRDVCLARGEAEGLTLTSVVEQALHDWARRQKEPDVTIKLRFIATLASLEHQELALRFLWYLLQEPATAGEKRERSYVEAILKDLEFPASIEEQRRFFLKE